MKKFVCSICGYVHEGENAPEKCPQCGVPASKFNEMSGEKEYACEHIIGVAQGVDESIIEELRSNFVGECTPAPSPCSSARPAAGPATGPTLSSMRSFTSC